MKRLIAAGLVSGGLLLVSGCGNTGYGTATGKADLTSFNGNPGTPSCSNPARPANTALYCPAVGLLPYPFDAYFAGSTDGTLNIQPPNATWANQSFLNDIDGFSTNAVIRERFNGPIDAASLATPGAVVMIHINTNNAGPQAKAPVTPAAVGGTGAFAPLKGCVVGAADCTGADYSVGVAADDPTTVEITPLHPLAASTCLPTPPATTSPCETMPNGGNGEAYLVLLTKAITVGGVAAAPDVDYANFLTALAGGTTPTCPSITVATLNALCQLTGAHLALAQLYAHLAPGFNPANVVASFSFSTESTIDTLELMSLYANPTGQTIQVYNPPGFTTAAIPKLNLPGHADVYIGVLSVPYYLGTPAQGPTAPVTAWWEAPPFKLDPTSTNVTRFNPLPVATNGHLLIPLLVTVPNAASAYHKMGGPLPRPGGWPVVIFQHGLARNREDVFGIADSFADAGFVVAAIDLPLHGVTNTQDALYASAANPLYKPFNLPTNQMSIERTFDLDLNTNNAAGNGVIPGSPPDGKIDPSGSQFINIPSPLTTRDNLREGVADLVMLSRLLPGMSLGAGGTIDASAIQLLGLSLGAIEGTTLMAVVGPGIGTATLSSPAGNLSQWAITSPALSPEIIAVLESKGLVPGTTPYANYWRDIQAMIDSGDPVNYIALATAAHPIQVFRVVGAAVPSGTCTPAAPPPINCPDQVIPPSATLPLITASAYGPAGAAGALTRIPAPAAPGPVTTAAPGGFKAYLDFIEGDHGSLIDNKVPSVTAEMQIQALSFFGSPIPPNPANPLFPGCLASTPGTLICIFDPLVIAP